MKKLISSIALTILAACAAPGFAQASPESIENDPAYLPIDKVLDLKTIQPTVNVNLPRFLLKDAASALNGGPDDPLAGTGINLADLVKDVKLIRVVVIEAKKGNPDYRAALEKGVKALRTTLESKWTAIVSVPEEKESVGVYALGDPSGESTAGLAVLVYGSGDAVIANIVGRVPLGKLIQIAGRMDKLPKDFLKKLGGISGQASSASAPATTNGSEPAPSKKSETPKKRIEPVNAEPKKSDSK